MALDVVALGGRAHLLDGLAERLFVRVAQLVVVLLDQLFELIAHLVRLVARLDQLELPLVLLGVRLGVLAHPFDLLSRQPDDCSIRTDASLPVPRSLAETFRMPFWSMSNLTSICGMPRGAGGMPSRLNSPSSRLSHAIFRSPW
jgi:hypothetical protein